MAPAMAADKHRSQKKHYLGATRRLIELALQPHRFEKKR
jgi:hypothetical protein